MTEETIDTQDDLTRRTVLRKGAATSAIFALGGTAVGQTAAAKQGGTGFVPEPEFVDREFRIVAETPETLTRSPSCESSEPDKTYQGYEIVYEGAPPRRGTLFVNPERNLETETDLHEFVRDEPCGAEVKVTFKPTR